MFRNREDAALRLARMFRDRPMRDPVVLGIPRGGVVLAAILARELNADLDVVLARKIRAPGFSELAIGAVAEDGSVRLDPELAEYYNDMPQYVAEEIRHQRAEIDRRKRLMRGDRPPVPLAGRTVIVTDDGIATGATMLAALCVLPAQKPFEVLVAVPVASPDRLEQVRQLCDEVLCPLATPDFRAVGEFYEDFHQVEDEDVLELLRAAHRPAAPAAP